MATSNKPTLFEELRSMLRDAMQDIRHKVVEEPWFGRETTKDAPAALNVQHNHDYAHQHEHTYSHTNVVENKAQQNEHKDLYGNTEHHDKQLDGDAVGSSAQAVSPYVKDGLPATFDEYLAKHHGMNPESTQEQSKATQNVQEHQYERD